MRLFSQLLWYFLTEWRRYFGAVMLFSFIAGLQLIPPRLVGFIIDGISQQTMSIKQLLGWISVIGAYCIYYLWITLYLAVMVIWRFL